MLANEHIAVFVRKAKTFIYLESLFD